MNLGYFYLLIASFYKAKIATFSGLIYGSNGVLLFMLIGFEYLQRKSMRSLIANIDWDIV